MLTCENKNTRKMESISKCNMNLKFQKLENMSKIRLKFTHSVFPQAPELIEQLVQAAQTKLKNRDRVQVRHKI